MGREHNERAWNRRAEAGARFARPAGDEEFLHPLKQLDGLGWLGGDIRSQKVLCLAAGGGRHAPLYAAAGAHVTVVDISAGMLELDQQVAAARKLVIRTVKTSMDDLAMFHAGEFDLVVHPVSTCYLPQIAPVFAAVAHVTRPGGLYISQHKSPISLQADIQPSLRGYELIEPYYRSGPLPPVQGSRHREEGTLEYLHRLEEILGGICRAGFGIEDLVEPFHAEPGAERASFGHRSQFVAPYLRIKARRKTREPNASTPETAPQRVWLF